MGGRRKFTTHNARFINTHESMSRRRRSPSQPEYIQLQPYRALVGVPVKSMRPGLIHAIAGGALKGALFALIPVAVFVVAMAYFHGGLDRLSQTAIAEARWAGFAFAA